LQHNISIFNQFKSIRNRNSKTDRKQYNGQKLNNKTIMVDKIIQRKTKA